MVGYNDGFVYVQWKGMEFNTKFHCGPVTGLKFSSD